MSNRGNTKKRRLGGGDAGVSDNGGGSELVAIKSMMQELVQQNRTQTNMINSMQAEITQLSKKCMSQNRTQTNMMQSMQGDITLLTKKCNTMEATIKSVKLSQGKSLAAIKTLQSVHGVKSDNTQLDDMNSRFDKLEQTIEKKQVKIDDRLKYHEILLQNQKWKYSAPHPSPEYWNSLDYDENRRAEDFLRQIKKCTEEMRYGQGDGSVQINFDLPYNEALLPHWKEFANALEQYHYHRKHSTEQRDNVSKLRLLGIELPNKVLDLLSNALQSTHFNNFALRNNNFGQKGIKFALDYLENNTILKTFYLSNNPINSMADIKRLCEVVKRHSSIYMLELPGCKGADIDGFEMLKMVMNYGKCKLEVIDLSNNNISTGGDTFISDFLVTDPILEALYLEKNQLDDNDAIGIAEALKQNTHLRFLRLTNNNITKTGWVALRKAEFDNASLNAVADSNHRCNIKYPPDGNDEIEGLDIHEMNGDRKCKNANHPIHVREMKIYSILSTRNRDCSNVKHLDDVPVEILPDMLDSIQTYSNYRNGDSDLSQVRGHAQPLSIVYEVCRHWDESLAVFEALSS